MLDTVAAFESDRTECAKRLAGGALLGSRGSAGLLSALCGFSHWPVLAIRVPLWQASSHSNPAPAKLLRLSPSSLQRRFCSADMAASIFFAACLLLPCLLCGRNGDPRPKDAPLPRHNGNTQMFGRQQDGLALSVSQYIPCLHWSPAGLPLPFPFEPLLCELLFGQLLRIPRPRFKPAFYSALMVDLCKLLKLFPRAMSACVR
jgi:hypothetical protein